MYEYTTGTRPDWENVGIELPKEVSKLGRQLIAQIQELPPSQQLSALAPLLQAATGVMMKVFPKLLQDKDAKEYLEPKALEALGRKLYLELVGLEGDKYGLMLTVVKPPKLFELKPADYDPDVLGVRIRVDDLLGFADECLEEGRIVVPDILDFYCRGKMEILSTYGRRADWSAMPMIGALIFLVPKMWQAFQDEKVIEGLDEELKKAKV